MNILITGGSGSIGRMICKQLLSTNEHRVIVLGRDHSKQLTHCHGAIHEVGRIEDEMFLQYVFRKHEINGVIHTAANKHVGVCENSPTEAVSANVIGSLNVLKAMESNSVQRGVFFSSDKACDHDHVYGITKFLMEKIVAEYAERMPRSRLNSMRFGNVFGSSGSVMPIWQAKINRGQDIELRVFEHERRPTRLAFLPSQASALCLDVFWSNKYGNGSVLMPNGLPRINLMTLAEVMVEGTESRIIKINALPMENPDEILVKLNEGLNVIEHGHVVELTNRKVGARNLSHRLFGSCMGKDETREFYKKVVEEMKEWM